MEAGNATGSLSFVPTYYIVLADKACVWLVVLRCNAMNGVQLTQYRAVAIRTSVRYGSAPHYSGCGQGVSDGNLLCACNRCAKTESGPLPALRCREGKWSEWWHPSDLNCGSIS